MLIQRVSCWTSLGASLLPFYLISLELIEEKFLLSSSLDHTVRLWSADGKYIGMKHLPGHYLSPSSGFLM